MPQIKVLRFEGLINLGLYPEHWQRDEYQPGFRAWFCSVGHDTEIQEALELSEVHSGPLNATRI